MSISSDESRNISKADAHNSLGLKLVKKGWYEEAICSFSKAARDNPSCTETLDNLAHAYGEKGDLINALLTYVKSYQLDPSNPYAVHNLGCFLSNFGANLAVSCFKDAIKSEPELYESHFNLALCYAADDNHEEALKEYDKALKIHPDDADVLFHKAVSLMAMKEYLKAITNLKKIQPEEAQDEDYFHNLACCYLEQGFWGQAEKFLLKALTINPSKIESILYLASLYARDKKSKQAKEYLKKAMDIDKNETREFIACDDYL